VPGRRLSGPPVNGLDRDPVSWITAPRLPTDSRPTRPRRQPPTAPPPRRTPVNRLDRTCQLDKPSLGYPLPSGPLGRGAGLHPAASATTASRPRPAAVPDPTPAASLPRPHTSDGDRSPTAGDTSDQSFSYKSFIPIALLDSAPVWNRRPSARRHLPDWGAAATQSYSGIGRRDLNRDSRTKRFVPSLNTFDHAQCLLMSNRLSCLVFLGGSPPVGIVPFMVSTHPPG
jgi:hypothetical protein